MNIALFDLDNTLIKGDSDYQWGNYLVENNYVDPVYYKEKNDNFFKQYRNGTLCDHTTSKLAVTETSHKVVPLFKSFDSNASMKCENGISISESLVSIESIKKSSLSKEI